MQVTPEQSGGGRHAGFGNPGNPFFWIGTGDRPRGGTHVAFTAGNRGEVEAFHRVPGDDLVERGSLRPGDLDDAVARRCERRLRDVPLGEARLGDIGLDEWLRRSQAGASRN